MANLRQSIISDALARYYTLQGYKVSLPLNLDTDVYDENTKTYKNITKPQDSTELIKQYHELAICYDDAVPSIDHELNATIQKAFSKMVDEEVVISKPKQTSLNENLESHSSEWHFKIPESKEKINNSNNSDEELNTFPIIGFSNVQSPIVHCADCKKVPIPSTELPVKATSIKCPNCQKEAQLDESNVPLPTWLFTSRQASESTNFGIFDISCSKTYYQYLKYLHRYCTINDLIPCKPLFDKFLPLKPTIFQLEKSKFKRMTVNDNHLFKLEYLINQCGIDIARAGPLFKQDITDITYWSYNRLEKLKGVYTKLMALSNSYTKFRNGTSAEFHPINSKKYKEAEKHLFDSRNFYLKEITYHYNHGQDFQIILEKIASFCKALRLAPDDIIKDNNCHYQNGFATLVIIMYPLFPHLAAHMWAEFRKHSNLKNYLLDEDINNQSWPMIDDDYEVFVDIMCNDEKVGSCKLPWGSLKNLGEDEALKASKEFIKKYEITNYEFKMTNYIREIHFTVKQEVIIENGD